MSSLSIIMLAGSLRPSPLRAELHEPALRMPLRSEYSLLDAWLDALDSVDPAAQMRIVITDLADIDAINALLGRSKSGARGRTVGVIREPTAWRGTAGLVRDLVEKEPADSLVAVLEAGCLPVLPVAEALDALTPDCSGVIAAGRDREPAGVYVLRRSALDRVATVGYSDMKEQLIPALHEKGMRIALVERDQPVLRIGDRRAYLKAVAHCADQGGSLNGDSRGVRLIGPCVVERGAEVESGAVIHESVILAGAKVGAGAVVSRSVIGRCAIVESDERIIERIVAQGRSKSRHEEVQLV